MKKKFSLLAALIFIFAAATAVFADSQITVNGTGEIRISADTAVISLGVNARDKDVLKAQQKANESIASIRAVLIENGVKETNINTEYINIYAVYDYQNGEEMLAAYNASSTLSIKVMDMESIGSLIDAAFEAGANTLNGISFSASDTDEAETEAMKKAVEDANKKAEVLAQASGLKITGIVTINEGGVYNYENSAGNLNAMRLETAESKDDAGTVVHAAKLIVSANVSITFSAE